MPSFEEIESKLTEEEVENNKDITFSLKINLCLFLLGLIVLYVGSHFVPLNKVTLCLAMIATFVDSITIILSIIFSVLFKKNKYKIHMLMINISIIFTYIYIFSIIFFEINGFFLRIILIIFSVSIYIKIIAGNRLKSTKCNQLLNIGSFFVLLTSIWEVFFGKDNIEEFIEAIFIVTFFSVTYKIMLNAFADHYKTLFYLLTYPEEFRKKFGYSVKDWYGVHSPQYKAEKESQ